MPMTITSRNGEVSTCERPRKTMKPGAPGSDQTTASRPQRSSPCRTGPCPLRRRTVRSAPGRVTCSASTAILPSAKMRTADGRPRRAQQTQVEQVRPDRADGTCPAHWRCRRGPRCRVPSPWMTSAPTAQMDTPRNSTTKVPNRQVVLLYAAVRRGGPALLAQELRVEQVGHRAERGQYQARRDQAGVEQAFDCAGRSNAKPCTSSPQSMPTRAIASTKDADHDREDDLEELLDHR